VGSRQHLAGEVARFVTVGGVATVVALVVFNALVHGDWVLPAPMAHWPLPAYVIANSLGMVVSYRGSRSWAFRHRQVAGPVGGRVAFVAINLASMAIPLLCLAFSRYVLHREDPLADNVAANGVGLVLGTAARFVAFRRFVFVKPPAAEPVCEPRVVSSRS